MPAGGCRGPGSGARAGAVRAGGARAPGASRAGDGARQPHLGRGRGPCAAARGRGGGLGGTAPDAARGAARPGAAGAAALAVRAARAAADRRVPAGAVCRDRPASARAVAAEGRPGPRRGRRPPRSLGGPCLGRPRPGNAARARGSGGGRVRGPARAGRLLQHRRPRARRQPGADRRAQRAVRPAAAPLALVPHAGPYRRSHRARDERRRVPAGRGGHGVPAAPRQRAHLRRDGGGDALAQRAVGAVGVRDGAPVLAEHGAPQPTDPRQRAAAAPAAGGDGRDGGRVDRGGEGDPRIVVGRDVRAGLHQAEPQESRDGRGGHAAGGRARAHGGPADRRGHGAPALERRALRAARRDDPGRLAKASAAGERVVDLLDRTPDVRDLPGAVPAPPLRGHVRFEGVGFAYDPGHAALEAIDCTVEPGQHVALVGPSGSGKSTLVSLILRLYDPTAGRVLIDGRDLREYTLASLRTQISVGLQDSILFVGTIRDSIAQGAPGAPGASPEAIEAVARLANAHGFIMAQPQGYDTVVGERGVTLSNGQRQRIAIARAAIRHAPLLILDEPTTGLDGENERAVSEALERLTEGRTTFLITHDLHLAARANLILYLDAGRVRERGTHAELLRAEGPYANLYRLRLTGGGPQRYDAVNA